MADAGFRLTVEGEREFKSALAAIDAQIKTNKAELKLLTEQYALSDDSMDGLVEKQKKLGEAYEAQAEKVRLLEEQYRQSAETYGENDAAVRKLKDSMIAAQTALASMANEQEKNQRAMDAAWESMERQKAALAEYDETVRQLDGSFAEMDAVIEESSEWLAELAERYDTLGGSSGDLRKKQENLNQQNELLNTGMETQKKKIDALNTGLREAEKLFGGNSDEVADYKKKLDAATSELEEMERQIGENNDALKDAADEGGNALYDILEKVSDISGVEIPDGIKNIVGGFDDASIAVGGVLSILLGVANKVTDITKETLDWADELTKKSQVMGIDSETYQALEYAAANIGVEMDAIDDAMNEISLKASEAMDAVKDFNENIVKLEKEYAEERRRLNDEYYKTMPDISEMTLAEYEKAMEEHTVKYNETLKKLEEDFEESKNKLRSDAEEAMKVFNNLGVEINDGTGNIRPIIDILYDVVASLHETEEPAERLSKAVDLIGEEARQLNPLFEAGADIIHDYMQEAHDLGIVLDNETVKSLDEAERKANAFGVTLEAVKRNLIPDFVQGLKDIKNAVTTFELPFKNIGELFAGTWDDLNVLLGGYSMKGYATGTYNHPGGYAVVGERGPEIVDLPRGSKVYPNGEIPDGMSGTVNYINVTIPASDIREFNDIVRIVQSQRQSTRMGYTGRQE